MFSLSLLDLRKYTFPHSRCSRSRSWQLPPWWTRRPTPRTLVLHTSHVDPSLKPSYHYLFTAKYILLIVSLKVKTSLHTYKAITSRPTLYLLWLLLSEQDQLLQSSHWPPRPLSVLFYFIARSDSHSQAGSTTLTSYQPLRLTLPSWKQNKHSDVFTKSFWTNKHTHILSLLSSYLYLFLFWQVENDPMEQCRAATDTWDLSDNWSEWWGDMV